MLLEFHKLKKMIACAMLHACTRGYACECDMSVCDPPLAEDKSAKIVFAASEISLTLFRNLATSINQSNKDVKDKCSWNEYILFF